MPSRKVRSYHLCKNKYNTLVIGLDYFFSLDVKTNAEPLMTFIVDLFFFVCFKFVPYMTKKFFDGQFSLRSFFKIKRLNLQPNMGNRNRGSYYFINKKNQHPFCMCSWKIWKSQAISHVTNISAWLYSNHGKCLLPGILGVCNPICYISQFIAKNMSYMISCGKHIAKSSDRSKCSKMRVRWGIWQLQ